MTELIELRGFVVPEPRQVAIGIHEGRVWGLTRDTLSIRLLNLSQKMGGESKGSEYIQPTQ